MSSADNLCKQFGPRLGPTKAGHDLVPNCLTLMVFLKDFFKNVDFEKKSADDKKHDKLPIRQRVKFYSMYLRKYM